MLPRRYLVFYKHALSWVVIFSLLFVYFSPATIILLMPFAIVDLWLSICLGLMFRVPVKRSNKPLPKDWEYETFMVDQYPVRWLLKQMDESKPLAILIHGWNSTATNMIGRSELYQKLGYNVVLFEMRAHGGNQSVEHWAAMHICYDLEQILQMFNQRGWLTNGFIVHGHSLGGFVAQRVLRPEIETSANALGMILESPVTSYEYINNQTSEYLRIPRILHKYMMHRLLKFYNVLNVEQYAVHSIEDLSTPNWGFPTCPTLLLQAKHDSTLGTKHAQLLIDIHHTRESNFVYHIVDDLKHTHEATNAVRDQLIRTWMDEQSLFFA